MGLGLRCSCVCGCTASACCTTGCESLEALLPRRTTTTCSGLPTARSSCGGPCRCGPALGLITYRAAALVMRGPASSVTRQLCCCSCSH